MFSFLVSLTLIVFCTWVFPMIDWMDDPEKYGYQRKAVPYGVGIVFYLCFVLGSYFFLETSTQLIAVLISGGIITLMSFFDDRMGLPAIPRLGIQALCALILVFSGIGVPALSNPFGDPLVLDSIRWSFEIGGFDLVIEPIADLVAFVWIMFVINAMNWLDGVPGMVSGMSSITSLVLFLLASQATLHVIDQTALSSMALLICGSGVAFWMFDFPRPKVLMGDSGTMFLGMILAVMAIFSGGKLAIAFILMAFPLMDAVWTIARRLFKKQSPFKGDFEHFHHDLMNIGMSESQVNLFYYMVSLSFGGIALSLQSTGKLIALGILLGLMTIIRIGISKKMKV
ncbi:MAG: MraY family glycosyltransferase [Candidatus Gracilibacteria bacterium]|nr:MraY family glycosyltransferase [Candidatus Gracilibacteria bacterium]